MDTINHWTVVESFRVVTMSGAEGTQNTTAAWFDKHGEPCTKQQCITLQEFFYILSDYTCAPVLLAKISHVLLMVAVKCLV